MDIATFDIELLRQDISFFRQVVRGRSPKHAVLLLQLPIVEKALFEQNNRFLKSEMILEF